MKEYKQVGLGALAVSSVAFSTTSCVTVQQKIERPNIVLIMADDMGYSDLGCYGSEIATPNIDALAKNGIRFTNFYNCARCCPTRASLLTGLNPHQAGMGGMVRYKPTKKMGPYQGYLNGRSVTLAEVLKQAGYSTMMSGKWHVGEMKSQWPQNRGFDEYYGLISGAMNFFDISKGKGTKRVFLEDGKEIRPAGNSFYATDAFTDKAVSFLDKHGKKENPFFMFLSYTAPHYPLHAKPEDIAKYTGKYMKGWDALRKERYKKMQKIGIITPKHKLSPLDSTTTPWDKVKNKEEMDLKMAIYAAQMECMDRGIGQVMQKLEALDKKDNTLVIFLSDNGACSELNSLGGVWRKRTGKLGSVDSYESYGSSWANAGNTPYRKFKYWTHEGGIKTPFVASWPARIKNKGGIVKDQAHIVDLMTTFCDIGNATYPKEFKGNEITPMEGKSLKPIFDGKSRDYGIMAWEHAGAKAIVDGDWKLVTIQHRSKKWALFNLKKDPTELNDLAGIMPGKVKELQVKYQKWAKRVEAK